MIVTTSELFKMPMASMPSAHTTSITWSRRSVCSAGMWARRSPTTTRTIRPAAPRLSSRFRAGPVVYGQAVPRGHDPYGRPGFSRGDLRRAPRSRHRRSLLRLHRKRLLQLGDDRCVARAFGEEHRNHPPRGGSGHAKGIVVEAELGMLGGVEEDVSGSVCLTEPDQAVEFVAKSGCDSLAVAIGTSHGAYKFAGSQGLRLDRLREIQVRSARRFPAGDARLQQRAEAVGRPRQQRRRQAQEHQRRERGSIFAGCQDRYLQSEHRHRWPAGLVRQFTARRSATIRPTSTCVRRGRSLFRPMPSTSFTRTRSWARPVSWRACASRSRRISSLEVQHRADAAGLPVFAGKHRHGQWHPTCQNQVAGRLVLFHVQSHVRLDHVVVLCLRQPDDEQLLFQEP